MSITNLVLRFAAPPPRIETYQRFLFLGPHPDDIEIGAGATAAKLADLGKDLCFLVCTDGRYGLSNAPQGTTPEDLIVLRQEEARSSAAALGVRDLRFLPFCDGAQYQPSDLERAVAKAIGEFQPDVIFAPDPDVSSECHADHLQVGCIAKKLAFFAPFREIMETYGALPSQVKALALYMTAKPNQYVKTKGYLRRQLESLFGSHQSQFPSGSAEASSLSLYLKLRSTDFGLRCLSPSAEGFRVLGQTQMHCLPELGKD